MTAVVHDGGGLKSAVAVVLAALASLAIGCVPAGARRASALLDRRDLDAANELVRQGLARSPDSREWLAMQLRLLLALDQRAAAVRVYRAHPSKRLRFSLAESVLWSGLRHHDPAIRLEAIQVVREVDAASLERDMTFRLDDPDQVVRTWAAIALSATPAGASALERQLHTDHAPARAVAVRELGRIAAGVALPTVRRYVTDRDAAVRGAAATALGSTGADEALAPLRRLTADAHPNVRLAAVRALGRLGRPAAAPALRAAIRDELVGVRLAAVDALARTAGSSSRDLLTRLAQDDSQPLLALRAGVALSRIGPVQPGLNAIARGLIDRQLVVRLAAVNAVIAIRDPVAERLVRKGLRDPQPRVRIAAARALLDRDRAAAVRVAHDAHALACAGSQPRGPATPAIDLCLEAAELLARAADAAGHRTLRRLALTASSVDARRRALRRALRQPAGPRAHELAVSALADADPRVSLAAAGWLYRELR